MSSDLITSTMKSEPATPPIRATSLSNVSTLGCDGLGGRRQRGWQVRGSGLCRCCSARELRVNRAGCASNRDTL